MATADLTVIALGERKGGASEYIAALQRRLSEQDQVRYNLHAMGTELEGPTANILSLVAELHELTFDSAGVQRVYTILKLDERRDRPQQTLDDKVASVESKLAGG